VFVVATMLTSLVLDAGLSLLIATTESQPIVLPGAGALLESMGVGFLVLEMWALGGFLLGTIARGPALSVGLGLVWALVIENLLRGVGQLLSPVEAFTTVLPGTTAGSLVGSIVGGEGTPGVLDTVGAGQAAVTVAAYILVLPLVAVWLVRRRDVS
jgi:hypothetical protein